jgi:hypothetical protein
MRCSEELVAALAEIDYADDRRFAFQSVGALCLFALLVLDIAEGMEQIFSLTRGVTPRFKAEDQIQPGWQPEGRIFGLKKVPHFVNEVVGVRTPVSEVYGRNVFSFGGCGQR